MVKTLQQWALWPIQKVDGDHPVIAFWLLVVGVLAVSFGTALLATRFTDIVLVQGMIGCVPLAIWQSLLIGGLDG